MNTPDTAPKDGAVFLGDFGWAQYMPCMWSGCNDKWVYAMPQIDCCDGDWDDTYFENEWEKEVELKGWIKMPLVSLS